MSRCTPTATRCGWDWTGRRVEVHETKDKVEIQLDARRLVTHHCLAEAEHQRVTLAEHRFPRGQRAARPDPHPEENAILTRARAGPVGSRLEAAEPQSGRADPAATIAIRARVSARTAAKSSLEGRPLWSS
jgi:hypothetical protein